MAGPFVASQAKSTRVMNDTKTIPLSWLLVGVLTVTILFNGIAIALS